MFSTNIEITDERMIEYYWILMDPQMEFIRGGIVDIDDINFGNQKWKLEMEFSEFVEEYFELAKAYGYGNGLMILRL